MAKLSGILILFAAILCGLLVLQTVEGKFLIELKEKIGKKSKKKLWIIKTKSIFLPVAAGMCYEPMLQHNCPKKEWRFFFDMKTHRCYGMMACPGGANNFKSWHECQNACAGYMTV